MGRSLSRLSRGAILFGLLLAFGCNDGNDGKKDNTDISVLLDKEPAGAQHVLEVKEKREDGDEVAVVGRIGGSRKPMIDGRAAFTIVDVSLDPCNVPEDEGCPTPWDYCCEEPWGLNKATLLVKFVDDSGKTVLKDAMAWLGVTPLNTVVVQGTLKRENGAIVLIASGIFIKK
jgi:hypothetical protein